MTLRKHWRILILIVLLAGYWLLPISGQMIIVPGEGALSAWPQFHLEPLNPQPGEQVQVQVTDTVAWTFVTLTVNGVAAQMDDWRQNPGGTFTWVWTYTAPGREAEASEPRPYVLVFYHDCHTGCIERGRITVGQDDERPTASSPALVPTKLGLVLPNLQRDWHGRSGWAVEIAYARLSEALYWGVDDLAARVAAHRAKGLRVLVRVDYDQQQSLPPTDDYLALTEYLEFLRRLARDERLREVYGYVIGNDFNTPEANALAPDNPVTPAWYARLFNGYGEDVGHRDNAVQVIRGENALARVIVGPLRPWEGGGEKGAGARGKSLSFRTDALSFRTDALSFRTNVRNLDPSTALRMTRMLGRTDLSTALRMTDPSTPSVSGHRMINTIRMTNVPWLSYMDRMVALLDEGSRAKAAAGIPLCAPDGFDVQAPGRPDAPEMAGHARAEEPSVALPREAWGGAQAGFRVYEDWLAIINAYPTTQGLPVYIISTNTYDREAQSPPAQNYPRGWLTTALEVVNAEPQVVALCWFLDDFPHSDQWDWFSLTKQPGRLVDAAEEFDALLRGSEE
jgi:hypothetical protein